LTEALAKRLDSEWMDLTVPATGVAPGSLHPITQIQWRSEDLFRSMVSPSSTALKWKPNSITSDALNIPADHPARDIAGIFWLECHVYLTPHPHLSVQVRAWKSSARPCA